MGEIIYNKLVRDNIPQIIQADNQTPVTRVLNDDDYKKALLEKLVEEARELLESNGEIGERADIAEVLMAIDKTFSFDVGVVEMERFNKAKKRGGFEGRIFLEKAITK